MKLVIVVADTQKEKDMNGFREKELILVLKALGRKIVSAPNSSVALHYVGLCSVVDAAFQSKDPKRIAKAKILAREKP